MNIYENPSFSSTLMVFSNGEFKGWLTLKLSKIKNSGFGVYSARSFQKNEFITCYLGEVDENPADDTYVFKKINGSPVIHRSGLKEDYWFGHRIQHRSGDSVNVKVTSGYIIKASKFIKKGKELFIDYNRSLFCFGCKSETDFYDETTEEVEICNHCRNKMFCIKICCKCNEIFICIKCYDQRQIC
jgi:hypothetical protein